MSHDTAASVVPALAEGMRSLLLASPVAQLVLHDGVVICANAAAADFLGAEGHEALVGQAAASLFAPQDAGRVGLAVARADIPAHEDGALVQLAAPAGRRSALLTVREPGDGLVLATLADGRIEVQSTLLDLLADPRPDHRGAAFLERLLLHAATATGAQHAMIGELETASGSERVQTLLALRNGEFVDNFSYALKGSPCADVYAGGACLYPENAASLFPDDLALAQRSISGYASVPLVDASERVLGALTLMFERPIVDRDFVQQLLAAYAVRAAAELQRIRVERRLADRERQYRDLAETSDDGLIVAVGRRVVHANGAAARILGFASPAALCAVADTEQLVIEADRSEVARQTNARLAGNRIESVFEINALHRDGHAVPVQVSASYVDWKGSAALQMLFVDVSARKQQQERVQQAERMASLGKLTGGIAHDFNNLLAVILGNLELVAQDVDGRLLRALDQARIAAQRGADLTERLLTFARRQALEPKCIAPGELLRETRALLAPILGEHIELTIDVQTERLIEVDPSQLQSALINLAVNARDAMSGGGGVEISARLMTPQAMAERFPELENDHVHDEHVCIDVSDSGAGMTPEVLTHAFEPFFTTKGASKGTGLGLSMVHGFIKQSRGQIGISSDQISGTRVSLFLPCSTRTLADPLTERAPVTLDPDARRVLGSGLSALVIEDEDSVREVAVAMLEGLGFTVAQAGDGPSGRDMLGAARYDLLLSDVVLPAGQRGPDIAADALTRDPSMAVLFMSGYAESSDFQRFRMEHDFKLMRKPFRFDQLRQEVEGVLAARAGARSR